MLLTKTLLSNCSLGLPVSGHGENDILLKSTEQT